MSCLRNQDGMALLLVLVVVALLSSLVIEFSFSSLVDLRATETFRDRTKAFYLARGGIEAARMILAEDNNDYDHPREFWGNPLANVPIGDGDVSITISDLAGRLNLNYVADSRGNPLPGYHRFVTLCEDVLQLEQMEARQLADSLVYWFDSNKDVVTPDDTYYSDLTPPYARRGEKLTTVDELRLVKGFTATIFKQIAPFVRVVGLEPININTASPEVLYAWQYSAAAENIEIILDRYDITAITDYRRTTPYEQLADVALVEGVGERWSAAWVNGSIGVKGAVYQVLSQGRINSVVRNAWATVQKNGNKVLSFKVE